VSRLVACDRRERFSHNGFSPLRSGETLRRGDAFTEAPFDEGLDSASAALFS